MQTARQLIEAYSSSSSADDLTTLAYVINYNFSFDYELTPDHIEAMRQNPDVLLTPTTKRNVNPLIVNMMLSSVSAGKHEWISQIKDLVTVDVLLHRYKVYNGIGAFAADRRAYVIDTASKFGFGPYLDQKAYRTAMAAVLSKEESLPQRSRAYTAPREQSVRVSRSDKIRSLYSHIRTNRQFGAEQIEWMREDPSVLTDRQARPRTLIELAALYADPADNSLLAPENNMALKQMSELNLITPEMLVKPSGHDRDTSILRRVELYGAVAHLNPSVYRKALALELNRP